MKFSEIICERALNEFFWFKKKKKLPAKKGAKDGFFSLRKAVTDAAGFFFEELEAKLFPDQNYAGDESIMALTRKEAQDLYKDRKSEIDKFYKEKASKIKKIEPKIKEYAKLALEQDDMFDAEREYVQKMLELKGDKLAEWIIGLKFISSNDPMKLHLHEDNRIWIHWMYNY